MTMKSNTLLLALVLAATALAGCAGGDDGTPTPASPTETTPTTPTETTPTTPTPVQDSVNETLDNVTEETNLTSPYDYSLIIEGVPENITANETFTFTLNITGEPESNSTHVGAHYADNDTAEPIASQMIGCEHFSAGAPGNHTLTCTIATPGTWYVRGHYRITEDGRTEDFWSAALPVTVTAAEQA